MKQKICIGSGSKAHILREWLNLNETPPTIDKRNLKARKHRRDTNLAVNERTRRHACLHTQVEHGHHETMHEDVGHQNAPDDTHRKHEGLCQRSLRRPGVAGEAKRSGGVGNQVKRDRRYSRGWDGGCVQREGNVYSAQRRDEFRSKRGRGKVRDDAAQEIGLTHPVLPSQWRRFRSHKQDRTEKERAKKTELPIRNWEKKKDIGTGD